MLADLRRSVRPVRWSVAVLLSLLAAGALAGCGSSSSANSGASSGGGDAPVAAVGAENEYADVIEQIGGKYVKVAAIESNPNTDPHSYEASPSVAQTVSQAQLIVQNGTDPAPQDVSLEQSLFAGQKVKAFVHNQQVTSTLTESFVSDAKQNRVPVVGVYETMPTPGYDYQSWMLAEIKAIEKAVAQGISTESL